MKSIAKATFMSNKKFINAAQKSTNFVTPSVSVQLVEKQNADKHGLNGLTRIFLLLSVKIC